MNNITNIKTIDSKELNNYNDIDNDKKPTVDEMSFDNYIEVIDNTNTNNPRKINYKEVDNLIDIINIGGNIDNNYSFNDEEIYFLDREFNVSIEDLEWFSSDGNNITIKTKDGLYKVFKINDNNIYKYVETYSELDLSDVAQNIKNARYGQEIPVESLSNNDREFLKTRYGINDKYLDELTKITKYNYMLDIVIVEFADGTSMEFNESEHSNMMDLTGITIDGKYISGSLINNCITNYLKYNIGTIEDGYDNSAQMLDLFDSIKVDGDNILFKIGDNTMVYDNSYKIVDILDSNNNSTLEMLDIYCKISGYYGGNQHDISLNDEYLYDQNVIDIVSKYFPDEYFSSEDLELLFNRMTNTGCGYISICNTIFDVTKNISDSEFESIFGFSRYRTEEVNGILRKVYNYEYLFLDTYLYDKKNNEGYNCVKDIYGNQREINFSEDLSVNSGEIETIGAGGMKNPGKVLEDYISSKASSDSNNYLDLSISATKPYDGGNRNLDLMEMWYDLKTDKIDKALEDGSSVIISMSDFTLYYSYDVDGNGILDDVYKTNVGGHSMSVTESLGDGQFMVSSWGKDYIVKPEVDFPNLIDDPDHTVTNIVIVSSNNR